MKMMKVKLSVFVVGRLMMKMLFSVKMRAVRNGSIQFALGSASVTSKFLKRARNPGSVKSALKKGLNLIVIGLHFSE